VLKLPSRLSALETKMQSVAHITSPTALHQHRRRMFALNLIVVVLIMVTLMVETGLEKTQWWFHGHQQQQQHGEDD
jgi:hypothetical protein